MYLFLGLVTDVILHLFVWWFDSSLYLSLNCKLYENRDHVFFCSCLSPAPNTVLDMGKEDWKGKRKEGGKEEWKERREERRKEGERSVLLHVCQFAPRSIGLDSGATFWDKNKLEYIQKNLWIHLKRCMWLSNWTTAWTTTNSEERNHNSKWRQAGI